MPDPLELLRFPNQPASLNGPQAKETAFRWATVVEVDPVRIQFDGDPRPLPYTPQTTIALRLMMVNDRVWTQMNGRRVIILGRGGGGETAWVPVVFENGWQSYSAAWGPVYYKRSQSGLVHFKGLMKPTDVSDINGSTTAFTLPEGFRPSGAGTNGVNLYMASGYEGNGVGAAQGTSVRVNVHEDGTVAIEAIGTISNSNGTLGSGPWVSMSPVSFLAER